MAVGVGFPGLLAQTEPTSLLRCGTGEARPPEANRR